VAQREPRGGLREPPCRPLHKFFRHVERPGPSKFGERLPQRRVAVVGGLVSIKSSHPRTPRWHSYPVSCAVSSAATPSARSASASMLRPRNRRVLIVLSVSPVACAISS
jgi:hypothetical protein